jgi:3-deoxy-D-manno-octulosonate 8-phosphate phosphatase (KDO 8-P phosphatase)
MLKLFENNGGRFFVEEDAFINKIQVLKAFVFDWDGVFTDGGKDFEMQSRFNEADSMGCNLLRFSYFLKHGKLPATSIISGENNKSAFAFVNRESFHSTYFKIPDKILAADHFCKTHDLSYHEMAYVFDDVLDLSIAKKCGLRIFIPRKANPLLIDFVIKNELADYMTASSSGNCAVREACELIMGTYNLYDTAVRQRIEFSDRYKDYLALRKAVAPEFFTLTNGAITPCKI